MEKYMKKITLTLTAFLLLTSSLFAGSLVVNNDQIGGSGQGIYEYSDDGSEYTKIANINFAYSENTTIIDHANGKVYLKATSDPIADPDYPGGFRTYQYYVMFDKATGEFTGEYGDDLFTAFETLEYDRPIDALEDGLVNSSISATADTASENSTAISVNSTKIAANTTGIATNTTNITANTTDIAANTSGIASNVVRLDSLGALSASNASRVEGLETLTGLMQNEYRSGIASSIALSQIQYAASGFSIGVGHGEFKNKDEMAVGIGYGGQFNEDVGFQFQFGSSGDSTGFGFTVRF
jgi:hypothetical protein